MYRISWMQGKVLDKPLDIHTTYVSFVDVFLSLGFLVKKSSKNEFSQPFPISPSEPGGIERFKFDEPSPDDVVVGLRTKGMISILP